MSVFSKNAFDILGNDADEEGRPTVPVQTVDKTQPRKGKRDAPAEAPVKEAPSAAPRGSGRGGRGGRGRGGSEGAFQDRSAGRSANRDKPVDDGIRRDRHANRTEGGRIQNARIDGRGGRGGAGGRGGRGGKDDRHSRTGIVDSAKQSAQGWGEDTGNGEWNDEKAGEQIAAQEGKEEGGFVPDTDVVADTDNVGDGAPAGDEAAAPAEPEDKSMSLQDYYASLAAKREAAGIGSGFEARKANEGAGKKQPEGKEILREEDDYFIGGGGKNRREREKKEKNQLVLEHDFAARERDSGRGGRGGRGRGRGDGGFRGEGRGRGRGGRGGDAGRGDVRGGRGGRSPNIGDLSAFPSLGGS